MNLYYKKHLIKVLFILFTVVVLVAYAIAINQPDTQYQQYQQCPSSIEPTQSIDDVSDDTYKEF